MNKLLLFIYIIHHVDNLTNTCTHIIYYPILYVKIFGNNIYFEYFCSELKHLLCRSLSISSLHLDDTSLM